MLRKLKSIERGQTFMVGGFSWIVIEHKQEGTLVLMETCLKNTSFDEDGSNDWRRSSIRKYLNNNFLCILENNGLDPDDIIETEVDLTADDGLKDYGTSRDKVFLLTADMYRKNRDVIKPINGCWWLITPYSTPTAGYTFSVRVVNSDGSLNSGNAFYGSRGLRPALILKSDILVSTKEYHVDETTTTMNGYCCLSCGGKLKQLNAGLSTDKYECPKCGTTWYRVRHTIIEWVGEKEESEVSK